MNKTRPDDCSKLVMNLANSYESRSEIHSAFPQRRSLGLSLLFPNTTLAALTHSFQQLNRVSYLAAI